MRLNRLTIAGFRGFNAERNIEFHDKLTVIGAPNSHGKTSISEALEFLIYGATSKVEKADSKDEYKDSYRNRHFPAETPAYIEAVFTVTGNPEQKLRLELDADGGMRRFVDGKPVENWPFHPVLPTTARPFVLQHALKYLLLVPPSDRFQGFARLLGLNEVDSAFQAILGLCTKPTASLPSEAQRTLTELESLEARIKAVLELKKVAMCLKRGTGDVTESYSLIETRADTLLGVPVNAEQRIQKLIAARTTAAANVYSGDVSLHAYSPAESQQLDSAHKIISDAVNDMFLQDYGKLCVQGVAARLQKEATLLKIGVELIKESPDSCPLCKQALNDELRHGMCDRHATAKAAIERGAAREQSSTRVNQALARVKEALKKHTELFERRIT